MKEPFLFDLVNKLYHTATDNFSDELKEQSELNAFVLGFIGSEAVIRSIQFASEKILPKKFNDEILPYIEKGCRIGITTAPIIYAALNPYDFFQVIKEHPTYSSGMIGAYLGLMDSSNIHIKEKLKEESLFKKIKKGVKELDQTIEDIF